MQSVSRRPFSILTLTALLSLVVGCSDDPVAPGVEPEVVNDTDVFQFQVSSVNNYTGTLTYTWTNTGTLANVDQSCAIASGQASLVLLDADGTELYSKDLATDGSFASGAGTSGDWQVRVTFTHMSGTLNFRAEKRTP